MFSTLWEYRKALVAAIIAAMSYLIPVVDDGLTTSEILGTIVAGAVAGGVTWGVPNKNYRKVR